MQGNFCVSMQNTFSQNSDFPIHYMEMWRPQICAGNWAMTMKINERDEKPKINCFSLRTPLHLVPRLLLTIGGRFGKFGDIIVINKLGGLCGVPRFVLETEQGQWKERWKAQIYCFSLWTPLQENHWYCCVYKMGSKLVNFIQIPKIKYEELISFTQNFILPVTIISIRYGVPGVKLIH